MAHAGIKSRLNAYACLVQDGTCRNKEPSSDKGFFGLIFAMLVVPAVVILVVAFASGYMVLSSLTRNINSLIQQHASTMHS